MLTEKYGETSTGQYLTEGGKGVVEIFTKPNGTWTITITLPNGMTCLVAAGESFEEVAEVLPPEPPNL